MIPLEIIWFAKPVGPLTKRIHLNSTDKLIIAATDATVAVGTDAAILRHRRAAAYPWLARPKQRRWRKA